MLFSVGFWVGAAGGGAVVWFGKTSILNLVMGTEALVTKLRVDAKALEAKITPKSS